MVSIESDLDDVMRLHGLFVGQLDAKELAAFARLVNAGWAHRSYEGAAGFLGLAKVIVTGPPAEVIE